MNRLISRFELIKHEASQKLIWRGGVRFGVGARFCLASALQEVKSVPEQIPAKVSLPSETFWGNRHVDS